MSDLSQNTALILIDVQKGFDHPSLGARNNPDAELNIKRLLDKWRITNRPLIHFQHASRFMDSPLHPSKASFEIKDEVKPLTGEKFFQKDVHSAFIGTGLEEYLRAKNINDLVIVGLITDHCVSTTTRMGYDLGFNVILVADATATFGKYDHNNEFYPAELVHKITLASLHQEFAEVMDTATVIERC